MVQKSDGRTITLLFHQKRTHQNYLMIVYVLQ